jgi:hypothetical protein
MDIKKNLKEDLKKFDLAPYLFVGSGISRRYLGLENWENLLRRFCVYGMKPFAYYFSRSGGKFEWTASLMAEDYHKIWFTDERFEKNRNGHEEKMIHIQSPLKCEISEYLKTKRYEDVEQSNPEEIEWFKKIIINGIITTNWDNLLEELFQDFEVFVGQKGLLNSTVQGIAEIYKIHGSVSDFNTLVLTGEDYEDFNDKNLYLVAKLLTIIIEHPIIFLGYSISDENIRQILKSVSYCLSESGLSISKIEDKLFFVEPIFDKSKKDMYDKTYITVGDRNLPITVVRVKDYSEVYKVLAQYERKLSTRFLKQIISKLKEIVKSNDPSERISAIDITDEADLENVDFAIGVGIREGIMKKICTYGYLPFAYDDLLEDIILDNKHYDPEKMVKLALPQIISRSHYTPFYKYLRKGNFLDKNGNPTKEVHYKIRSRFDLTGAKFETKRVRELVAAGRTYYNYTLNPDALMAYIQVNGKNVDLEMLRDLILSYINQLRNENFKQKSRLRKVIRIYDWLKYGP